LLVDAEPADVAATAGVEDIDEGTVDRDADRHVATGRLHVAYLQTGMGVEHGDVVAAGVDGQQPAPVENQGALRTEPRARAETAGGDRAVGTK
jgi:hypothetical protein